MEGWGTTSLKELAKINYGKAPPKISYDGDIPVIGTGGIGRFSHDFLYNGESVILGRKGTINNPIYYNGKIWVIDTAFYLSDFKCKSVKWLYYVLSCVNYEILNEATGVPSLSRDRLYTIQIEKPPENEEDKIAKILSTVDKAIEETERLIAKYENIKTGLMQDLLTKGIDENGKIRSEETHAFKDSHLGRIPVEWGVDIIENVSDITTGNKDTQDKNDFGKYPFIVRSQTVERIDSYSFNGEGILTSGDGVGVGKIYHYLNCKFDYHQRVYLIFNFKPAMVGKFLFYFFRENFFNEVSQYSAKTTVDSVRYDMIAKMNVPIPPENEQKEIVKVFNQIELQLSNYENEEEKYNKIKRGLMQDLLKGKVRVNKLVKN